jgi:threonine dehydratase
VKYIIDVNDIRAAATRLAPYKVQTPLVSMRSVSQRLGRAVYLKAEYLQPTGSFKVRGALNTVLMASEADRAHGFVAFSTGNHGRALAWAATQLKVRSTVFISTLVPEFKRAALRAAGAEVVIRGSSQDEAEAEALEWARRTGSMLVSPIHPHVIAGHGTAMLEILEQCPSVEAVVVPVSAGGLAAGVALAAKSSARHIQVVGVTMEMGAAMHASLAAGKPVQVPEYRSLADSLGGGVGGDSSPTFPIIRDYLEDVLLVTENAIGQAMVLADKDENVMLEGAGATPLALAMNQPMQGSGPIVLIASGGNVDPAQFTSLREGSSSPP